MLNQDIRKAQKIVSGAYSPLKDKEFHQDSFIYKTSNEDIRKYQNFLSERENIFSITASGDQILNSILLGAKKVTACDISRFPNYFLALKIAAIKNLDLDDYINFFFSTDKNGREFSYNYFEKLEGSLSCDDNIFWNSLFQFFEGDEIYKSMLFSHEVFNLESVKDRNLYLEKDNYNLLKKKINDVHIKYCCKDLASRKIKFDENYDLVNLSSIIYYGDLNFVDNYKKLLNSFNLNDDGAILTYLYDVDKHFRKEFVEENFSFHSFSNTKDGVMVYKKVIKN